MNPGILAYLNSVIVALGLRRHFSRLSTGVSGGFCCPGSRAPRGTFLPERSLLEPLVHAIDEHRATVLRAGRHVVMAAANDGAALVLHVEHYTAAGCISFRHSPERFCILVSEEKRGLRRYSVKVSAVREPFLWANGTSGDVRRVHFAA